MSFILRILFTGLITFVPSQDGKEVTVLLLNVPHQYHLSDGTSLANHKPLLIARAGNCTGNCPKRDSNIAQFMFADQTTAAALDSLEAAVAGGGAWDLSGSDLAIRKGSTTAADLPALELTNTRTSVNGQLQSIPSTSNERQDFSWVADLKKICPSCSNLNADILGAQPPAIVAARLRLRSGKVFTYSIARIGNEVTPVKFERLDGQGSTAPYSQAIASWVGADIAITGDDVEIVDTKLDGTSTRSMKLSPDSTGKVEVAVLNIPSFVPPETTTNATPEVGKHFEIYYELKQNPPALGERYVPKAGAAASLAAYPQVDWQSVHPPAVVYSDLLNQLRLNLGRSLYNRILCPPTQNDTP
ncbi:MAG: hypothetical protein M3Q69_06830 [Acidobacteriota bacterium]|nr:hypothetical protein [Acidobacteriota bacterium]